MVNAAGGIVIAILVLLLVAGVGWVIFTQLRARRLGVSQASLFASSFLPLKQIQWSHCFNLALLTSRQ